MPRKLTIAEIKEAVKDLPIELVSTVYTGNKSSLIWRHTECGCIFKRSWVKINQTQKCPKCTGQERVTIAMIKRNLLLENRPIQVLSKICTGSNNKLLWGCLKEGCRHEWEAVPSSVMVGQKTGCPVCARNIPLTIDIIKERIKDRPIECLSTEYINNQTLMLWQCNICSFIWKSHSNNITILGNGCPDCGKVSMNITNAQRHKVKWERVPAIVYFIRCWNDTEEFYKVGITIHKVKQRMYVLPYNYEIIREIHTSRYKAVFLEISYHDKLRPYSYRPQKSFGGETECFSVLVKEKLYG